VLPVTKKEALRIIEGNQEIIGTFNDEGKEGRYWEMRGFAWVPCGGTHLRKTGEIGEIELKRKIQVKGKKELKFI
jgi:Ser-tRNA(Ala) deacylase AlaX